MISLLNSQNKLDAVRYRISVEGQRFKLSRNFLLYELVSDDDEVLVHHATILGLQALRDYFDKPIRINSFYRTSGHNARVGGRPQSLHLSGMAADIDIVGVTPSKVADKAESMGFGGVGRYNTFTHVDTWKTNRRWDVRTPATETP